MLLFIRYLRGADKKLLNFESKKTIKNYLPIHRVFAVFSIFTCVISIVALRKFDGEGKPRKMEPIYLSQNRTINTGTQMMVLSHIIGFLKECSI